MIWPCCANWSRSGASWSTSAIDTSESVEPLEQIELAEAALYKVAEGAGTQSEAQGFSLATRTAIAAIEKAFNSGGHISGKTTGLTSINEKVGGLHDSDLIILAGRPGHGQDLARHQYRLQRRRPAAPRSGRRDRTRPSRSARRRPSSASK